MNQSQKKLEQIEKRIKLLSPPNPSDFVGGKKSAAYKTALANWKKPSNYPKGGPLPLLRSQNYKPDIQKELDKATEEQQHLIKRIQTPSFRRGQGPGRSVANKDYIPNFRTGAELQIKGFPAIDYRSGEDPTPGASGLTVYQGRQIVLPSFAGKYGPKDLKNELGATQASDPQKGTDQINTGSGKFAHWYPDNERNQPLQIAAAKKNETTTNTNLKINPFSGKPVVHTIPTTNNTKLKISSDVHTIDPSTGEPVGVLTRSQRRAFEARADVQEKLREAQKNKTDLRIYKDRLGKKVTRTSGG